MRLHASPLRWIICLIVIGFGLLTVTAGAASAATVPPGFDQSVVASALDAPTALAVAPDGTLFVTEQGGRLVIVPPAGATNTALTLTVDDSGERGLLGVALHPDYPVTPKVYLYYTATQPTVHNRVSSFDVSGTTAGNEQVLLDLPGLVATNHNGGALHFGPDGALYIGVGENAVTANSQNLATPLGKMLRINADGSVPSDNPFVGVPGAEPRVWALGLRNPFTFAFDPATGRMLINDVGAGTWEEVNEGEAGANYGWPDTEGPTSNPAFHSPLFAYNHGEGCAIVGATFTPPSWPLPGDYLFGDLCQGWLRSLDIASGTAPNFATAFSQPVDLAVDSEGALYVVERGAGTVTRIAPEAPAPVVPETSMPVALGLTAIALAGGYRWVRLRPTRRPHSPA